MPNDLITFINIMTKLVIDVFLKPIVVARVRCEFGAKGGSLNYNFKTLLKRGEGSRAETQELRSLSTYITCCDSYLRNSITRSNKRYLQTCRVMFKVVV